MECQAVGTREFIEPLMCLGLSGREIAKPEELLVYMESLKPAERMWIVQNSIVQDRLPAVEKLASSKDIHIFLLGKAGEKEPWIRLAQWAIRAIGADIID